jgi:hypothetical protein
MQFFSRPVLLLGLPISHFQITPLQYFMHTTYYSVEVFHLQLSVASALLSTYPTQHPVFTHRKLCLIVTQNKVWSSVFILMTPQSWPSLYGDISYTETKITAEFTNERSVYHSGNHFLRHHKAAVIKSLWSIMRNEIAGPHSLLVLECASN